MLTIADIVAYFENLAVQHPLLRHTAGTEDVFEVRQLEDAFGQFRARVKEKAFVVRLILPSEIGLGADGGNAGLKIWEVGLLVAKWHGSGRRSERAAQIDAMAVSEKIADEIVERVISDARAGHPLFLGIRSAGDLKMSGEYLPTVGDNTYGGYAAYFRLQAFRRMDSKCSTPQNVGWIDGGLTTF